MTITQTAGQATETQSPAVSVGDRVWYQTSTGSTEGIVTRVYLNAADIEVADIDRGEGREPGLQCTRLLTITKKSPGAPTPTESEPEMHAWAVYLTTYGSRVRRNLTVTRMTDTQAAALAEQENAATTSIREPGGPALVHVAAFDDERAVTRHWVRVHADSEHARQEIRLLLGRDYRAALLLAA